MMSSDGGSCDVAKNRWWERSTTRNDAGEIEQPATRNRGGSDGASVADARRLSKTANRIPTLLRRAAAVGGGDDDDFGRECGSKGRGQATRVKGFEEEGLTGKAGGHEESTKDALAASLAMSTRGSSNDGWMGENGVEVKSRSRSRRGTRDSGKGKFGGRGGVRRAGSGARGARRDGGGFGALAFQTSEASSRWKWPARGGQSSRVPFAAAQRRAAQMRARSAIPIPEPAPGPGTSSRPGVGKSGPFSGSLSGGQPTWPAPAAWAPCPSSSIPSATLALGQGQSVAARYQAGPWATRWLYHAPRNTPVLWWALALVLRGRRRTEAVLPSAQRPSWAQLARPGGPALNSRLQESPRPASERPRVSGAGGKGGHPPELHDWARALGCSNPRPWGGVGSCPVLGCLGELTMACSVGGGRLGDEGSGGFGQASCSHRARRLARLLACIHWDPASPQNVTQRSFASSWAHELSAQLYTAASIVFPPGAGNKTATTSHTHTRADGSMRRLSTPTSHKLSESAMLAVISFWRHACSYKVHSPMLPSRRPRQSQLLVCHAASPIQPQRDVTLLIPRLSCQVDGQWRCFDEKQAAPLGGAEQDWRSSCPKSNATTTAPFEPAPACCARAPAIPATEAGLINPPNLGELIDSTDSLTRLDSASAAVAAAPLPRGWL
ncbi:hypothetical protein Purlil1_6062 [Purpureocillium lilacinum]|uniref:Uncharacterized protein n=1 Tax=Purpureocillium lilacinum TaxID=33203 RepID=A0ABR0C197_PURLI|nr:hypothetical protein Purlil1_6062 [Purpureocillium lilacinum]